MLKVQVPPAPVQPMPPAPPAPPLAPTTKRSVIGRAIAVVGVAGGFLFMFIIGGFFALRSFLRWRDGKIRRPTFAWISAGWTVVCVAFAVVFSLLPAPLIYDNFSNPSSGFGARGAVGWTAAYAEGEYRIWIRPGGSALPLFSGVLWNEGPRQSVRAEVEVHQENAEGLTGSLGVALASASDASGYLFSIGPGAEYHVAHITAAGAQIVIDRTIESGQLPPEVMANEPPYVIRADCRLASDGTDLLFLVDSVPVVSTHDPSLVSSFTAVELEAGASSTTEVDARFDNLRVTDLSTE